MSTISRRLITDAVLDRLRDLDGVTVYDAEIAGDVPLSLGEDGITPDPGLRVAPYVVVYPSPGAPDLNGEADLGDAYDDLDWSVQITCAAGYRADTERLVDRVHTQLFRWVPVAAGAHAGRLRPPTGYQPGNVRRDDTLKPPRFWVPLQYRCPVTADTTT